MELVEVEILTQTITSQYGVLSQGDILRTSPEFAKHLVEDAGAAKFVAAKEQSSAKPSEGLKVEDLKAALEAKGISIPEGAKKADLAALLDSAPAA
ncbi:HeH/LEM domain-containing protein [Variovorax saccharolyticus]|uniref:HeH/LEM domain-containing protein n=1 Tax=Variovorax saccharolyticus TaxID=3053516 RepID=UPI0025753291|nr:HeH/LEM domain-containing protein [Variovorax sp. J31P216]MDM0024084.1 HeH/LEM domain-containing protein [Variovorax sp. J31P216]